MTTSSTMYSASNDHSIWSSLILAETAEDTSFSKARPAAVPVCRKTVSEPEKENFEAERRYSPKRRAWDEPVIERRRPVVNRPRTGGELERADMEAARQRALKIQPDAEKNVSVKADDSASQAHGWLGEDPCKWRGRKVRNRKTRAIFTIRQVFKSGRVELQKTFMLFLVDVEAVRKEYDIA